MPRFHIENFGCRATQADGAALERQFLDRGMERAGRSRDAEIVVLNTCTVTEDADKEARASIRRWRRINPDCRILITGCYAQRAPEELAAMPGVTWVVGNSHKHRVAEIAASSHRFGGSSCSARDSSSSVSSGAASGFVPIAQLTFDRDRGILDDRIVVGDIFAHTELLAAPVFEAGNHRTRPILKVQDGCDNRCSFCVIPSVRGQSRSMTVERVIAEVQTLVGGGYRELVISGINLGRWGKDLKNAPQGSVLSGQSKPTAGERLLVDLIRAILARTLLEKLRISSVEPMDWSDELIALVAESGRIAKHAHVPMQSGSDAVLRRMHRKYRPWHYAEKIRKIRRAMPTAAIGADVMVGFPGETEAEFEETRRTIEELPFTYLHVFTYSARPGTAAASLAGQVPVATARERNRVLRELATRKKVAFVGALVGQVVEAITLRSGGPGYTDALTDNYLKIRVPGRQEPNRRIFATVEGREGETLLAREVAAESMPDIRANLRGNALVEGIGRSPHLVTQECTERNIRIDR